MALDKRNLKTPIFSIEIGDVNFNNSVVLPDSILRLVEKIDITEILSGEQTPGQMSTAEITFVEGSREPAGKDSISGDKRLYPLDKKIRGTLTNRPGILPDLKFSGKNGITFATANQINTTVTQTSNQSHSLPEYLFYPFNQIRITWGYAEDPNSVRIIALYITLIKTNFQENGATVTTVICQPLKATLNQIAPINSTSVALQSAVNGIVGDPQDYSTTKQLLTTFCKKANVSNFIISDKFPVEQLDKKYIFSIPGGISWGKWLDWLAQLRNATWGFIKDPRTNQDVLVFLEKSDFESSPIPLDESLLYFNSANSIIKSINITVDFSGLTDSVKTAVDQNGNPIASSSVNVQLAAALPPGQSPVNNNPPIEHPIIKGLVSFSDSQTTSRLENTPYEAPNLNSNYADLANADNSKKQVQLEIITIGNTSLYPGTINIQNIGVRYSGQYKILTSRHLIDRNGYTTIINANSMWMSGITGSTVSPQLPKTQSAQVNVQLANSNIMSQYHQLQKPNNNGNITNQNSSNPRTQ